MRLLLNHFLALCLTLAAPTVQRVSSSLAAMAPGPSVFQTAIPEATEACTDEEAKWWTGVRLAGSEFAAANRRKDQAVRAARSQAHQRGRILSDDDDGLSGKERTKFNTDIDTARQNYLQLLRQGTEHSYRAPIRDTGRAFVVYSAGPNYTEQARRNKTMGIVKLRVEFRADGTIGAIDILQGLADGLEKQAVEAMRRMVFLPATKDRLFVTISKPVEVDFNLR